MILNLLKNNLIIKNIILIANQVIYKSIDLNVKFILGVEISFVGGRR